MIRVFVDTNIVIDFYQRREPFFLEAASLFQLANDGKIELVASATTFINAFYLLRKSYPIGELYEKMKSLFLLISVSDVTSELLAEALTERWKDFEDCVQYLSAAALDSDVVLTRNKKDFQGHSVPVMTPTEFFHTNSDI